MNFTIILLILMGISLFVFSNYSRLFSYSEEVEQLLEKLYPYVEQGKFEIDDYYMNIETPEGIYSVWIANRYYAFLSRANFKKKNEFSHLGYVQEKVYDDQMPSYKTLLKWRNQYIARKKEMEHDRKLAIKQKIKDLTPKS